MSAGIWSPQIEGELRDAAVRVAVDLARRVSSPKQIEAAASAAWFGEAANNLPPRLAYSLSNGYAGLALLFGQIRQCLPGDKSGNVADDMLQRAVEEAESTDGMPLGVSSGLCGLGLAAQLLAQPGTGPSELVHSIDELLVLGQAAMVRALKGRQSGFAPQVFDVISGLTGIARYWLLRRARSGPGWRDTEAALGDAIGALIALARDADVDPRWHVAPSLLVAGASMARSFPNGYVDCGLAHGIPGPLGALALARLHGVDYPGLDDAIGRLASWLASNRCDDAWGLNWPYGFAYPVSGYGAGEPARAGWCYGSPGVARALDLAGQAIARPDLRTIGQQAIDAALARPAAARSLDSPYFCHGLAGLLQVALRFQNESPTSFRHQAIAELSASLVARFEPNSPLGYRDHSTPGRSSEEPGVLDGPPGVALVLLAATFDVEPAWDCGFLLS